MDAIVEAVGETKAAIRLSPWMLYQDMGMEDPIPQFTYLVNELKQRHPNLAYLHVISAGVPDSSVPKDESVRVSCSWTFRLREADAGLVADPLHPQALGPSSGDHHRRIQP